MYCIYVCFLVRDFNVFIPLTLTGLCFFLVILQVVDQLQSGGSSKKNNWAKELPVKGLGVQVLEKMETEKRNDPNWQGKCSGTVYVSGS